MLLLTLLTEGENVDKIVDLFLTTDFTNETISAMFSSFCVMLIIIIVCIIVNIKARKVDPLKKPKGIVYLFEFGVTFFDNFVDDLMGPKFKGFGGFLFAVAAYVFLSFIFGLTGLTSPMTNMAIPLSLGFLTFSLIHITSIKHTKGRYFKRFIEPIPVFLPVNILSMWAPLLSLTLRLFGNALAGWTLMSVVYYALENVSALIFSFVSGPGNAIIIAPIITPILHAYFDLFSGFIQTTVFVMVSSLYILSEVPEDEEVVEQLSM